MATTAEAAREWGVIDRRVRKLCEGGRIEGAIKNGRDWYIPAGAIAAEKARRTKLKIQNEVSDSQEVCAQ